MFSVAGACAQSQPEREIEIVPHARKKMQSAERFPKKKLHDHLSNLQKSSRAADTFDVS
jgi:hypothetical protein